MVWNHCRPRVFAYRMHRSKQPAGWVHTLSEEELEKEIRLWYHAECGRRLDLKHPRSFSEKMQWLKVHDNDPRKTAFSDKLTVRDEVAMKVGKQVLTQVYCSWDNPSSITFDGLPPRFFLKCNNGSGMMLRIEELSNVCMDDIRDKVASWFSCDFASHFFELHYAGIMPHAYAVEWIDDFEWEYQAWCFSGKVEFIAAIHDPHGVNEKQFFSPKWEKLPFVSSPPEYGGIIDRPGCLEQIVKYSESLSDGFAFVRVDWYGVHHGLMFSEMTFTPAYGIVKWVPASYDMKLGELIHLPIEG